MKRRGLIPCKPYVVARLPALSMEVYAEWMVRIVVGSEQNSSLWPTLHSSLLFGNEITEMRQGISLRLVCNSERF